MKFKEMLIISKVIGITGLISGIAMIVMIILLPFNLTNMAYILASCILALLFLKSYIVVRWLESEV